MDPKTQNALIYIVDDEFAVRDSLKLLTKTQGLTAITFDSAEAFLHNYVPEQPSCLILDVKMPIMSGLELQEELALRNIDIPIIFISGNAEIPETAKAFRAGAVDFLEKPFDNQMLLERIEEAIKKDINTRKKRADNYEMQQRFDSLTAREKEVLSLIINSHTNKEAAKILDISYRTIDSHRVNIMKKMQAEDLAALVMMTSKVMDERHSQASSANM